MPYSFARSEELFTRAQRSIAGGVNSGIRKMEAPVPLYFERGDGAELWDVDGNRYIDYQIGQGALFFGHAPAGLAGAVSAQAHLGMHWAAQSMLEIEVAEKLQRMIPSAERVRFGSTATEAAAGALRLARAYTGRRLVLKFEGHYHGWSDEGLVGFANPPAAWGEPESPARSHPSQGVIPEVLDQFVVARWNDPEHLKRVVGRHKGSIAAIIFEPVLCNTCCIEASAEMVSTLRTLCDRDGIVLIADETITGLRFGPGGAQQHLKFAADLTILGKALGGGVPIAALAGRAAIMELIAQGKVVHAGTLNSNPLCLAASKWCLDALESQTSQHREAASLGGLLMAGLAKIGRDTGVPLRPQGPGITFHTVMPRAGTGDGPIRDYRQYVQRHDAPRWAHLRRMLLEEGVRAIERGLWFVSLRHSRPLIEETLQRAERAFARHAKEYRP